MAGLLEGWGGCYGPRPVKIHCIGGGPASLYLAILAKKSDPRHEVTVWERNSPGDTFGWGVVFSDLTQENLRDADPVTYDAITRSFSTWDAIDVHHKGQVLRSEGHGFCGMGRKKLLQILQERADTLSVKMHFRHEVEELDDYRDCDLLVGADGLHSLVRKAHEDSFRPHLDVRPNRYIWFGTHQSFDAFTFSFRRNQHGLFRVHAYQFEPGTSTFIVEADPETWKNAGLDKADEAQSIDYCSELFSEELGGHELLGNRSRWIQFPTVRNECWHHENVVLLGDAAHTAHFSIGSGTKLAMEDAIALVQALREHVGVEKALIAYEEERRPVVERIQRAAQRSLEWFEDVNRYMSLDPNQFLFSLLTRSLRVTRDNLALRDPECVHGVERWFMAEQGAEGAADPKRTAVPAMFLPFDLRGMRLENRVVVSPMCQYSAEDGTPNDWHLVHIGSRAIGGAGLVMCEMTDVSREGRISPGCAGMYKDEHVDAWARIVAFVHQNSKSKIGIQLGHAGRKGSTGKLWEAPNQPLSEGGWPLIAPSPIPWSSEHPVPREMTREDMENVRDDFVRAAKMSHQAGFDLLELHFAHGYLLSSFLTPLSNQRSDEYGGSLENRARFPLEVLDAVREVWPSNKPLSVRISATDWVEGGFGGDDAVALSILLKERGVDLIDVSAGQTSPDAQPVYGRAFQTPFSDRIRHEVGIPTLAVGNVSTYDDINTIVLAGRADLVALARAHLADPYFTLHAAREQGYAGFEWPLQYQSAQTLRYLVK